MTIKINRRAFMKSSLLVSGVAVTTGMLSGCATGEFVHGIASGDPLQDGVIIWTRVTPQGSGKLPVEWEVATDPGCQDVVQRGIYITDDFRDYTVKVDVKGLIPGTKYYYRFRTSMDSSPIGETRTLPQGSVDRFKVAVFSCSNYPAGYFNVYKHAAGQDDLDAVMHIGDYFYEYGMGEYATEDAEALGRVPAPETELLTLQDYRTRYAQYHTDPDLQALHAKLPFITVWDDHEIANDAWKAGAENHNDGEGDYFLRKANAIKAYFEWMPIRERHGEDNDDIYRSFEVGDLVSLYMLETRVLARDKQLDYADYMTPTGGFDSDRFLADLSNPGRALLGDEQKAWLQNSMATSGATWQVLGQQILMGRMNLPIPLTTFQIGFADYIQLVQLAQTNPDQVTPEQWAILQAPSVPYNLDAWDGYPVERETVLETSRLLNKNLIVLAGDTHNAWASNLKTLTGESVGVEFATPGVTSPGLESYLVGQDPNLVAAGAVEFIPDLKWANTQYRGYMTVTFTPEEAVSQWILVDTVKSQDFNVLDVFGKSLKVLPGVGNRQIMEV
ncbi:alkaline phosphatase D family protein [Hahella ganghwensis]|uniref:alkaline phosphatase D family protein n=1 Tax=Hahella ganghwensis TaxID=286420 RepID=UPI0003AAAE7B|nr:alkaline phosphatase D family protein [Hahella ganghwensis]